MYSVLIDTHDKDVLFVLYKDGKVLDKINKESNMRHSEIAMPSLIDLIERNGLKNADIGEIFTVIGPGSFTGVRIGVTIAKTLAYLLKKPIRSVSSIDLKYFSNGLKKGFYGVAEKNGYFIAEYDGNISIDLNITYYSIDEYNEKFNNIEVLTDVDLNLEDIYKYASMLEPINPHLVNPIYVKKIEVEK
jgi:tRNA threonylcarbamoyladenosine biosynthesis protein TsaB